MKAKLSLLAMVLSILLIAVKVYLDYNIYKEISEILEQTGGDISPSMVAGGIKVLIMLLLFPVITMILGVVGYRKKNAYRVWGVTLSAFALVYAFVPLGLILTFV